jgi:MYXO-CTERM domain-containing protein
MRRFDFTSSARAAIPAIVSLALVVGCTAGAPDESDDEPIDQAPAGAISGKLVTYILDFEDHSETQYVLRDAAGREKRLEFPGAPGDNLKPGARLHVWGTDDGQTVHVARYEVPPVAETRQALIGGMKKPDRRWAFVMVNTGGAMVLTKEMAQDRLFNVANPRSMKSYYREVSYGLQDLDGEVIGPLTYKPKNACDSNGVVTALRPMVQGQFDQYLWYFGTRQAGCGWAGLAALGTADRPQPNSWYNASSGCVVLAQEPGHNFGMVHSSAMRCQLNGAPVPMIVPGAGGQCAHSEYGNLFDPMGSGCYHMDGFQKAYQNWISGCNVVKVTSSGTFTLQPLEKACAGVQLLQIPLGKQRVIAMGGVSAPITSYYVELRAPVGLDAGLMTPRVLVTVGGDIAESRGRGGRNWLVDMNPQTASVMDAALPVGKMYADPDPAGPKFTVMSADSTKAVIQVQLGSAAGDLTAPGQGMCDDQTAFTAPGPDTCSAAPVSVLPPDGGVATDGAAPAPDAAVLSPDAPPATPDAAVSAPDAPLVVDQPPSKPPAEDASAPSTPVTPPPPKGGCGCTLGGQPVPGGLPLIAGVLGVGLLLVRRRRRI